MNRVVSNHFPYFPVKVAVQNQIEEFEVLLDTGFDGDIIVPQLDIKTPDTYVSIRLGDESTILAPACLGSVTIGAKTISPILVISVGFEPILGRNLAKHFSITLDHGRRLIIEL